MSRRGKFWKASRIWESERELGQREAASEVSSHVGKDFCLTHVTLYVT